MERKVFRQDLDLRLQVVRPSPPPPDPAAIVVFEEWGVSCHLCGTRGRSVAFLHRCFPSADSAATVHTRSKKEHVIIL